MFGNAKVTEALEEITKRLDAIEALLATEVTWKEVADRQTKELKELRDRFMAKDFQEYATMREVERDIVPLKPPKYDPLKDDDLAGEIVDGN